MADLIFNVAKGRVAGFYDRVDSNDPANSALILVPVSRGAVTDAQMRDFATLAAVLAGGVTERTTGGWVRKTLTDADTPALTIDNTNDRVDVGAGLANVTWSAVSGSAVTDVLVCYDSDTTGGADSAVIPLVCLDYPSTPDGSDIVLVFNAGGFARAS